MKTTATIFVVALVAATTAVGLAVANRPTTNIVPAGAGMETHQQVPKRPDGSPDFSSQYRGAPVVPNGVPSPWNPVD